MIPGSLRTVTVAGGKGGAGKTTVAVGLAVAARRAGLKVHLADCDVEGPNAHLFLRPQWWRTRQVFLPVPRISADRCRHCGNGAALCAYHALAALPERTLVFEDLCRGCGGCRLVCPEQAVTMVQRLLGDLHRGRGRDLELTRGQLRVGEAAAAALIRAVGRDASASPRVIRDAPPGAGCPVAQALRGSDYVLLVAEPTPFGRHDLELAVELTRALDLPCGVIVNRDGAGYDGVDRYCEAQHLEILARIPFKRMLADAGAAGRLPADVDPEVARIMDRLVRRLWPAEESS